MNLPPDDSSDRLNRTSVKSVLDYIRGAWDSSVRCGVTDPNIRPVPVPHTVPSPGGKFRALFYWDTYFTNLGLLRQERIELAKSNCDAFAWLVDQVGHVPNSVFLRDDQRSQPPYFSQMVREVFDVTGDKLWLANILPRLETEHRWWMERRACGNGLNRHGHDYDNGYLLYFYQLAVVDRLKAPTFIPDTVKCEIAAQMIAEGETGWDFTPVFDHRCAHFASVHLNTLLWQMEVNLAFFCRQADRPESEADLWEARAAARAVLMRDKLWSSKRGLFLNYDFIYGQHSRIAAIDTFAPLAAGFATQHEAATIHANLPLFEREYGLACTEDNPLSGKYQWAFPVSWPPMTWLAVSGLHRYGYQADARRLAEKYLATMTRFFHRDKGLWEKYDVRTGEPSHGEYEADPMLGWCAGVFVALEMLVRDA